jgi:hypothetical protein
MVTGLSAIGPEVQAGKNNSNVSTTIRQKLLVNINKRLPFIKTSSIIFLKTKVIHPLIHAFHPLIPVLV